MVDGWKKMELSIDQKKKFIDYINSKWPEPQICPICHAQKWSTAEFIGEIHQLRPRNLKSNDVIPVLDVTCLNCGYIFFINAMIAGILNENEVKDPNEAGSAATKNDTGKKC